MKKERVLLVHENVHSARFLQHLLEEAGHVVEWRPSLTPTLLRSGAIPDAVIFDLHFLDQEDQASLRSMCEHPRWKTVPVLVTAAVLSRQARLLLSRTGADDVMLRPVRPADGRELLIRLRALLSNPEPEQTLPLPPLAPAVQQSKRTSLADIATLASVRVSSRDAEAILVQPSGPSGEQCLSMWDSFVPRQNQIAIWWWPIWVMSPLRQRAGMSRE